MQPILTNLRPHLVSFFFKEFEGKEAVCDGKKVKAVKIAASSSLGIWFKLFSLVVDPDAKVPDYYNIYLSMTELGNTRYYQANYYKFEHIKGGNPFICMPEQANEAINLMFEDIFRMSFINFLDGYVQGNGGMVKEGINEFIEKYDLLEFGFSNESLRVLYYREKKKAA
jgi:hypothetical protein